jgi:hypothetical protein
VRSTLDELISELDELRSLVESIDPVNAVLSRHADQVVQRYVSIRRRFDYAAFIVALYASFEKYVENLITAYIRLEAKRVSYTDLPKKLTDKHLAGTAELLGRRLGDGRYAGLNELDVVRKLYSCLSGEKPYDLNEAAVITHDANLRASEVDALFSSVGIEKICDRACKADAILSWYRDVQGLDTTPQDGIKRTIIDERLKDIVERRNQVAHRGGNPTDLLGREKMNETLGFIECLATSIFGLIVGLYLQAYHATSSARIELILRDGDGPFKHRTVVIVEKPAHRLYVGQPVFVLVQSTGARWGRIQSLRVDDLDVMELEPNRKVSKGVGVGLDFKFPNSTDAKLIALEDDDDVVWAPN